MLIIAGLLAFLPAQGAIGEETVPDTLLSQATPSPIIENDPDDYRPSDSTEKYRYPEDRTRPPSSSDWWDDRRRPHEDYPDRLRSTDCESDEFKCPRARRINCMPPVRGDARNMCAPKYLNWVRRHCPDVEVVY